MLSRYLLEVCVFERQESQVSSTKRGCVLSLQSCPTLCNPVDYSPPGFSVQEFSRQEYWSGLPCPAPRDLPNPRVEPTSPAAPTLQEDCTKQPLFKAPACVAFVNVASTKACPMASPESVRGRVIAKHVDRGGRVYSQFVID